MSGCIRSEILICNCTYFFILFFLFYSPETFNWSKVEAPLIHSRIQHGTILLSSAVLSAHVRSPTFAHLRFTGPNLPISRARRCHPWPWLFRRGYLLTGVTCILHTMYTTHCGGTTAHHITREATSHFPNKEGFIFSKSSKHNSPP